MKTWVKGGLIGFVILTVLSTIGSFSGISCFGCSDDKCCMETAPVGYFVNYLMSNIINFPLSFMPSSYASSLMVNLSMIIYWVYHFIIGALIGWIYGKIKSR